MSLPPHIERNTERRDETIYPGCFPSHLLTRLEDAELPLSLKFTAILSAFAHLEFPLTFGDLYDMVPHRFWTEHIRCIRPHHLAGNAPIFWEAAKRESYYILDFVPQISRDFNPFAVYFAASSASVPWSLEAREFTPPLDTNISRYTLSHPFLARELHDPSGIYLFKYTRRG